MVVPRAIPCVTTSKTTEVAGPFDSRVCGVTNVLLIDHQASYVTGRAGATMEVRSVYVVTAPHDSVFVSANAPLESPNMRMIARYRTTLEYLFIWILPII